jgi:hypothetical protein
MVTPREFGKRRIVRTPSAGFGLLRNGTDLTVRAYGRPDITTPIGCHNLNPRTYCELARGEAG